MSKEEYLAEERAFFRDIHITLVVILFATGVIALVGWLV